MSVLNVIQLKREDFFNPDVTLRQKSASVTDFGSDFQKEVDDLVETFRAWKISVGLSAPQIGIFKRVAIINIDKANQAKDLIIVNPDIISEGGKKDKKKESCLTFPKVRGEVERRENIHISFQNRYGKHEEVRLHGFEARAVLHEIDHLNGILFVDRIKEGKYLEDLDIEWK